VVLSANKTPTNFFGKSKHYFKNAKFYADFKTGEKLQKD
jgi:hypothetical protein